jgi:hypothetical protein
MLRLGHIPAIRRRLGDRDDRGVQTVTLFGPAVLSGVGRGDDLFSQASRRERCHTTAQVRSTHANILPGGSKANAGWAVRTAGCRSCCWPGSCHTIRLAHKQPPLICIWPTTSPRSCAFGPQLPPLMCIWPTSSPRSCAFGPQLPPLMCIWPTSSPRSCAFGPQLAPAHVHWRSLMSTWRPTSSTSLVAIPCTCAHVQRTKAGRVNKNGS